MKVRLNRVWCGRIVAVVILGLLLGYLWRVGLSKANALAGVLSLLVAVVALVGPYLFPRSQDVPVVNGPLPGNPELTGSDPPGVSTDPDSAPEGVESMPVQPTPSVRLQGPVVAAKESWIAAAMMFADMQDPEFRRSILRQMGDRLGLGQPFPVPYRPLARDHAAEIVDQCWDFKDPGAARRALAESLVTLRPDTRAAVNLERMLADSPMTWGSQ
jgi:hypothetical protein